MNILNIKYKFISFLFLFYKQFIREINLRSDPFDGDIVQALESSFIKLVKNVDHPEKENITKGNTFLLMFVYYSFVF